MRDASYLFLITKENKQKYTNVLARVWKRSTFALKYRHHNGSAHQESFIHKKSNYINDN